MIIDATGWPPRGQEKSLRTGVFKLELKADNLDDAERIRGLYEFITGWTTKREKPKQPIARKNNR